jgi:LDH2 family malate/lactate/ureidoglycolate dehydrogenase
MRAVTVEELWAFCVAALTKVGVGEEDARTTADVLVTTDAWGIYTHGVKALGGYIRRIRAGGIRRDARPTISAQGPGWALIDGGSGLGMVTSVFAMRAAIGKARACGIGYAGVFNSCHFGAAGYYAAMAAAEDMIGLAMANDTPSVSAPGAKGRITGSNPIAYALPTGSGPPIILDMATSTVAGGKVTAAAALGKSIPEGWLLGPDGRPTTDPGAFPAGGALTPMAGHKGYGLALLIEGLSAVLTGAAITRQVGTWAVGDPTVATGHGAAFIALDVGSMMPAGVFKGRVDAMVEEIRGAPRADGCERIYVPGEIEWDRRQKAVAEGIPLPEDVRLSVASLARDLDMAPGFC